MAPCPQLKVAVSFKDGRALPLQSRFADKKRSIAAQLGVLWAARKISKSHGPIRVICAETGVVG